MTATFVRTLVLSLALLTTTACSSLFGGAAAEPTATVMPLPTFTATPASSAPTATPVATTVPTGEVAAGAAAEVVPAQDDAVESAAGAVAAESETDDLILLPTPAPVAATDPITQTDAQGAVAPTATPDSEPRLTVSAEAVNVRGGPDTAYAIVGAAIIGQQFPITGRDEAGDWWQICCFDGQPGWLYAPLVTVQNGETVVVVADLPPLPVVQAEPAAEPESAADPVAAEEIPPAEAAPVSTEHSGTAGNFDPNAQYQIVGYRVIGYGENNGGIFDNGGQHMIFVNVIDAAGNGIDGAVIKDAVDDKLNIVTGSKGPGRAEFEMFWDRYKLYVASDPSGPVTSQISNQMNTAYPHIPDIIGKLGPADNEYAICPTPDDRCEPPFYHAHWSYEITFQKVK